MIGADMFGLARSWNARNGAWPLVVSAIPWNPCAGMRFADITLHACYGSTLLTGLAASMVKVYGRERVLWREASHKSYCVTKAMWRWREHGTLMKRVRHHHLVRTVGPDRERGDCPVTGDSFARRNTPTSLDGARLPKYRHLCSHSIVHW